VAHLSGNIVQACSYPSDEALLFQTQWACCNVDY